MYVTTKGHLFVKNFLRCIGFLAVGIALFFPEQLRAQTADSVRDAARAEIDQITGEMMKATGVPSAVIAVLRNNKLAYEHAYGDARLDPRLAARTDMPYSVGSISKQFTATAILMLAE